MAARRRGHVVWNSDLRSESGVLSATTGGAFSDLSVMWGSYTESADGCASPEEQVASAHAICFAMALSAGLGGHRTPPEKMEGIATVTFDEVDGEWKVVSSELTVRGKVPSLDEAGLRETAEGIRDGCPISQALKDNV